MSMLRRLGIAPQAGMFKLYVINSNDDTISVVLPEAGIVAGVIPAKGFPTCALRISSRAYVSLSNDNSVEVIDITTDRVKKRVTVEACPEDMAPCGASLYVANVNSGSVSEIAVSSDEVTRTYSGLPGLGGLSAAARGDGVFVLTRIGVHTIDPHTHTVRVVAELPGGNVYGGIFVSPKGKIVVGNHNVKSVDIVDPDGGGFRRVPVDGSPYDVLFTADGDRAYVAVASGQSTINHVMVVDLQAGAVTRSIDVQRNPAHMLMASDLHRLFVANVLAGTISCIDTREDVVVKTISLETYAGKLAYLPSTHCLAVTCFNSASVALIDLHTDAVRMVPVGRVPLDVLVLPG